ncbi:MAG: putative toxin-antitoxin system toxin component, PIN family [Proteobacteria bacterium]|nr:putative toxin-antitoxin system toxin component, PIN family [Pseudomonadota bacterium]
MLPNGLIRRQANPLRLVLDTNVWIDWLAFDDPLSRPIAAAQAEGRAQIFIDAPCEAELARALGYDLGKRSLDATAQVAALARMRAQVSTADGVAHPPMPMPQCRDADDQKFLALALACGADLLISRDRALLELGRRKTRRLPFEILTPAALSHRLASA